MSIARSADEYDRILEAYARDPILHWQRLVVREFVDLRPVPAPQTDRLPPAFEFRTFWWRGELVGAGRYWSDARYDWTTDERRDGLAVASEAARRLAVPFLVVDIAQKTDGSWLVIECNDGQESGYAGVEPMALWQRILHAERVRLGVDPASKK